MTIYSIRMLTENGFTLVLNNQFSNPNTVKQTAQKLKGNKIKTVRVIEQTYTTKETL